MDGWILDAGLGKMGLGDGREKIHSGGKFNNGAIYAPRSA
jgi:hypothetical protein